MNKLFLAALLLAAVPAQAQELTLNDMPKILYELRGCKEIKGNWVSSNSIICNIPDKNLWASINSKGELTLFNRKDYGDTTYAYGRNVKELLQDFAVKINSEQNKNKQFLESLAPYLATQ